MLIVTFTFNSCNKEDNPVQPAEDLTGYVGYWHNVALKSILENQQFMNSINEGALTYAEIRDGIIRDLSIKDPQLFDYESIRTNLSWSDRVLSEQGILTGHPSGQLRKNEHSPINVEAVFQYLYEKKEIGESLYKSLISLNNKVIFNEVSQQEIVKLSQQIGSLSLSANEKSYVDVFNQVLQHSSKHWKNYHARIQDDKTVAIIWADAAGGLYGMLCGPVCSIIEAAAFSTIVAIQ
jgi:hypothetical protein